MQDDWLGSIDEDSYRRRLDDAALLAGRIAHGFDNVLTGIMGFAELAYTQMPAGTSERDYIKEVLQAAQLGTQITQEFHQLSRSGTTRHGLASPAMIIADEENRVRSMFGGKVALHVSSEPDLPSVKMEPDALQLALRHVMDNALEGLGGTGNVSLSARAVALQENECRKLLATPCSGSFVEVAVTDSGAGIDPATRQRLFREPFFSTKARRRGLGLAVVYRILHAHGGGFSLGPGAAGSGVCARFCIPVIS